MKTVKQDEFEAAVRAIEPEELSMGRDVGRTHGIVCYYANGKHVATERWGISDSGHRYFEYEVSAP